jgi:hypothetical protein
MPTIATALDGPVKPMSEWNPSPSLLKFTEIVDARTCILGMGDWRQTFSESNCI